MMRSHLLFVIVSYLLLLTVSLVSAQPIFMVVGTVQKSDGALAEDGLAVTVTNTNRNLEQTTILGRNEKGKFSIIFSNLEGKDEIIAVGDQLKFEIKTATGELLSTQSFSVKVEDMQRARLVVSLAISDTTPSKIKWEKDSAEMVLIPAGSFEMGDAMNDPEEWTVSAHPVHTITLDAFYMDAYEVTVGQYKAFIAATGHPAPNWDQVNKYSPADEHPMIFVEWNDAKLYSQWAGKRLPTEAEWEYAARNGLTGKRYPWGDEITRNDANYRGTGGKDQWEYCAPVGSFGNNGYGLYDMAGNVQEWCADWYRGDYYNNSPEKNPQGPSTGVFGHRVIRGGGWHQDIAYLRVATRPGANPTKGDANIGFRCVSGSISPDSFTALPDNAIDTETTTLAVNTITFKSDATSLTAR